MSTEPNTEPTASLWTRLNLAAPTLSSALLHDPASASALWSHRDPVSARRTHFRTTYILSSPASVHVTPPTPVSSPPDSVLHPSPSRQYSVRFVSHPGSDPALVLEVWSSHHLRTSIPLPPSLHGSIYASDDRFGSVAWSPDERFIAYIADAPPSSEDDDRPVSQAWAFSLRHKFHANSRGPFGEGYVDHRDPALFIADLNDASIQLAAHPPEWHLGAPQWGSDWLICTALHISDFPSFPNDLGLRYCYNRPGALVAFRAPKSMNDLSALADSLTLLTDLDDPHDFSCLSPRLSPDGNHLVYLSVPRQLFKRTAGPILPHLATKTLRYIRVHPEKFSKPVTLIPVPEDPKLGTFPGIYSTGLIAHPWLDNQSLAFSTSWGFSDKLVTFKFLAKDGGLEPPAILSCPMDDLLIEDGFPNTDGKSESSVLLHDVLNGTMLISASDARTPSQLALLSTEKGSDFNLHWISTPSEEEKSLGSLIRGQHVQALVAEKPLDLESFSLTAREFDDTHDNAVDTFEVAILLPTVKVGASEKSALAVFPHGGPHVASKIMFLTSAAALLSRGFAVMFVNYRGSTGLGQASLETLLGWVGTQDVNEVVQATRWALAKESFQLDADKAVFVGGSHSGFLGAHTSLVPGLFKRTVLRNPVTNIATMAGASDIPDWCFAEAGLAMAKGVVGLVPNEEQLAEMYKRSPVSRVGAAKKEGVYPKTLLQVGGSDRRVPPSQSLEWRRALAAVFGEDVITLRWYEDSCHAIDDIPEGDDAWVQALDFICEVYDG